MLLRFGVANHRSIRDYQELFLSASRRIKREGLVIPGKKPDVVKYGISGTSSRQRESFHEIQRVRGDCGFR